jgi:hypothetical protein
MSEQRRVGLRCHGRDQGVRVPVEFKRILGVKVENWLA